MKKRVLFTTGVLLLGASFLYFSNRSLPLSPPPLLEAELPEIHAPAGMKIYQIPTGANHRTAAFAYRGGSLFDKRDFSMSALLIRHPQGDLLIDTGLGKEAENHFRSMPFYFRWTTDFDPGTPAAIQLSRSGYDIRQMQGILLTHAHWDHVSGVQDFENTPVFVSESELSYIRSGQRLSALADAIPPQRYKSYRFSKKPYLGFSERYDYYGDGSVVIVPSPGHTPGSVIIFVNLPDGKRYAMTGDIAWQTEGIFELEEKPFLISLLADNNRPVLREHLKKLYAIHQRFPQIQMIPAHDERAFRQIPAWK